MAASGCSRAACKARSGNRLRAALQPLQSIRFDAVQRGELARLTAAEALDAAPRLAGEAMLAGFYLNELTLRLAPRQDPQPDLFVAYATVRERLRADEPLAWTLRRFERDLLDALGFGFDWGMDGDGRAHRPRRPLSARSRARRRAACSAIAATATAAAPQRARRCSRWRTTRCRRCRTWPACVARCAACSRITWGRVA